MTIELAGISNENDFYSEHYLTTVFEGDIEETFRAWREADSVGTPSPRRKLEKVAGLWRRLSAAYAEERSDEKRLRISREFAHEFLDALSYERRSELVPDAEERLVPTLARRAAADGREQVWVVEVLSPVGVDFETDPLQVRFRCEQFEGIETAQDISRRRKDTAEVAVTKGVFGLETPPRFVVLLSMSQAVLIDRFKWPDSRLLRFRFSEIFGRSEGTALGVTAALLHGDSLAPRSGTPLIDRIDEESHRHAYGVSQDLKYALREAIEILGNEAADLIVAKRRSSKEGVFSGANAVDAGKLTTECLRYMYRLLFLFFIEARPELGFAPMKAKAYRTGYSLEALRELEMVALDTDEDRDGHYISDSLETLFSVVFHGTPGAGLGEGAVDENGFAFHAVRARLFAPEAVGTYLAGLRFRNVAMQRIVELLSLSRGGRGRGRISYAQLGISQLGAVYEALLSFSGFFATEDLVELKPAGKPAPGPLEAAFFAPKRRAGDFLQAEAPLDGEFVYAGQEARNYPKGTFIYRLAGRNRENSASYYTPEPLARVLVKYALKELLAGKKADDILKLRIVEPAMGSAAFLVEVVNQLADRYLELKQAETKRRIPHERHGLERQKVRAYLADRNVFGVDLNPVAVELGQVSLWLNCLHQGGFAPWFEDQVHAGNSLVGARRAVFPVASLDARREEDRWHKRRPREIGWSGESRRPDEIWHFLLPEPGMSSYDAKIVRPLAPQAWSTFSEWRRDFMRPLDREEIATVRRLSAAVDALFDDVADRLAAMRREVNDDISIWPTEPGSDERRVDFEEKIRRLATFHGEGVKNAVSWRRLRSVMDAWCALWFWPLDKAELLPSRAKFYQDLDLVLTQGVTGQNVTTAAFATGSSQGRLFETVTVPSEKGAEVLFRSEERVVELRRSDLFGDVDVGRLIEASPWLPTAMDVAHHRRFMHFDLEFADVMRERGGFDLVIGNPPWLKPAWVDAVALSEKAPEMILRGLSAGAVDKQRLSLLSVDADACADYLSQYVEVAGLQSFLSSPNNFPVVGGGQPNLYKCFVDLSFRITAAQGRAALIHQDNHLSDPNAGHFRTEWYQRAVYHLQFRNEKRKHLFAEIDNGTFFSLNVYRGTPSAVDFDHCSSLFLPDTFDECLQHDGIGQIPPLRSAVGGWNTAPHRKRIVRIDDSVLKVFHSVIESTDVPYSQSRFLYAYSEETIGVLRSLGSGEHSFSDKAGGFQMRALFHASGATKVNGEIEQRVDRPSKIEDVILSGPSIYVGNPVYKEPSIDGGPEAITDLRQIGANYLPRTSFQRRVGEAEYRSRLPGLRWNPSKRHTDTYRIAFRNMLPRKNERTLVAALVPPGVAHVHTVESLAFEDEEKLVSSYPLWLSLPYDFIVKTAGLTHLGESSLRYFPWAVVSPTAMQRALRLACVTSAYAHLWNSYGRCISPAGWSCSDPRLEQNPFRLHRSRRRRSSFRIRLA